MRRRRSTLILAAGITTAALLLGACGDSDSGDSSSASGEHGHDESTPVADGARRIEVTGNSFAFDPTEIRVTAGEDVAIVLTSQDLVHDFTVDELDVHVGADTGETAEGGLVAEKGGRYDFYCSVAGHRKAGMEGTLIVEET